MISERLAREKTSAMSDGGEGFGFGSSDGSAVQQGQNGFGDSLGKERRHGVANLAGDLDLGSLKNKIVREALKSGGLPMGDGAMLRRVEVAAFLRFVKLGADGEGGFIPPETAEKVGASGFFSFPAVGCQVGPFFKQIDPVSPLRDALVALKAGRNRASPEMEVHRGRDFPDAGFSALRRRKVADGAADGFPWEHPVFKKAVSFDGVEMGGVGQARAADFGRDDNGAPAALWDAVVRGV